VNIHILLFILTCIHQCLNMSMAHIKFVKWCWGSKVLSIPSFATNCKPRLCSFILTNKEDVGVWDGARMKLQPKVQGEVNLH
jgi:hypothetical protein